MAVRTDRLDHGGTLLSTLAVRGPAKGPAEGPAEGPAKAGHYSDARASDSRTDAWVQVAAVLLMAALTAAAAQISVPLPFTPVPFTLQPMIVLLGGAALGSRLGMASQIVYLMAGVAGLPVFAASPVLPQGPARLVGPTAGYLLSYPLAAFVTGWLAERGFDRRYLTSVLAMAAGLACIFAGGVAWLAWFARPAALGLDAALRSGLYPFLPADIFKVLAASAVLPTVWRLTGVRGSTKYEV